jgi:hypothetical protein
VSRWYEVCTSELNVTPSSYQIDELRVLSASSLRSTPSHCNTKTIVTIDTSAPRYQYGLAFIPDCLVLIRQFLSLVPSRSSTQKQTCQTRQASPLVLRASWRHRDTSMCTCRAPPSKEFVLHRNLQKYLVSGRLGPKPGNLSPERPLTLISPDHSSHNSKQMRTRCIKLMPR